MKIKFEAELDTKEDDEIGMILIELLQADMVVSLLGLVVVTEVLLGPLFRNETYISFVLNSLNSQEGFIAILIVVFLYAWATEEN
jgi:hypothetical protein